MSAATLEGAAAAVRAAGLDPAAVRFDAGDGVPVASVPVAALERIARSPRAARAGGSFVVRVEGRSVGFVWLEGAL